MPVGGNGGGGGIYSGSNYYERYGRHTGYGYRKFPSKDGPQYDLGWRPRNTLQDGRTTTRASIGKSGTTTVPKKGALVIPPAPVHKRAKPVIRSATATRKKAPKLSKQERRLRKLPYHGVMTEGDRNFAKGDYEVAANAYREGLRRQPGNPVALWGIALSRFAQTEFDLAAEAMHEALYAWPEAKDIIARPIRKYYPTKGQFERQMKFLESRIECYRRDARGRFLAGVLYGLDGNLEQATNLLGAAQELLPGNTIIRSQVERLARVEETEHQHVVEEPEDDSADE